MASGGEDAILLQNRFEILSGTRLSKYDQGLAQAYGARDRNDAARQLFALIAPGHLPCRAFTAMGQREGTEMRLLWPQEVGIVDWPIGRQGETVVWGRRPALIYHAPKGERMVAGPAHPVPQLSEQDLIRNVLHPILAAIKDLVVIGVPHRAIRPDNLFYQVGTAGQVVLGECLSMPPGAIQSAAFETIENAMADPMARGYGTSADDLYALGVLALTLTTGRDPAQGMSDEDLVTAKINMGSFSALAGGEKLPPSMTELLRGLLNDKAAERWSVKNVEAWALGQHFSPPLPNLAQRATRPIRFDGREYLNRPALAHALSRHWEEGQKLIDGVDFDNWLKRGFNDDKMADKLLRIKGLAHAYGPPASAKDRMLSRMIQFMGGNLPIAYKDLRGNLTGLGTLLANVFDDQAKVGQFGDMLRAKLPHAWMEEQASLRPEQTQMRKILEAIDKCIERPGPGFGIERALYEFDPATPCRSAMIADFYVAHPRDLLPAIDAALPGTEPTTLPMDRHIAAYIGANLRRSVERELTELANKDDPIGHRLAVLKLIVAVQRLHPSDKLPRLAERLLAMVDPAVETFHNISGRDKLRKQLVRLAGFCDFSAMLELLDRDGAPHRSDEDAFRRAQKAFAAYGREMKWVEGGGLTNPNRVKPVAQRAAAITAGFIASAVIAGYSVMMSF